MDEQLRENICDLNFPKIYLDNHEIKHLLGNRISRELCMLILGDTYFRCRKRRQSLRAARKIFIYTFITLAGGSQPHRTSWSHVHSPRLCYEDCSRCIYTKAVNRVAEYPNIQRASANAEHVEEILNDTYLLLAQFDNIIGMSALHVYHSALSFAPPSTRLHRTYSSRFPNRIIVTGGVQQHWRLYHSHLTALDLLRDRGTTPWDRGMELQVASSVPWMLSLTGVHLPQCRVGYPYP